MIAKRARLKCQVRGGVVEPCRTLASVSEYSHSRKGVVSWQLMDMKTGKTSRIFYGCKSGEHTKTGLVFNYCPWCRTNIGKPVQGGKKK